MLTKLIAALVLTTALVAGGTATRSTPSPSAKSCCFDGSDCCYPGSPCCADDCCASGAAGVRRRVLGVARFSHPDHEAWLRRHGVETVRCDLLDPVQLGRLPDAANVVFMTGMKFGSTGQEALTWAMNCHLPALVAQRFRGSRIVAFSTGNVYGLSPVHLGGSLETDALSPVGEYAMSCL